MHSDRGAEARVRLRRLCLPKDLRALANKGRNLDLPLLNPGLPSTAHRTAGSTDHRRGRSRAAQGRFGAAAIDRARPRQS